MQNMTLTFNCLGEDGPQAFDINVILNKPWTIDRSVFDLS